MSKGGERGYRYWEAMKLISGAPFPGGLSPWNDGSEGGALRHRLVNGDWHMSGYRVGKNPPTRENVLAHYSEFLKIDPDNDTAAGGGFEFVGVRFHPGAPPAPVKPTAKAESDCRKWLIGTLKRPRTKTKEDLKAQAMNESFPGLSGKAFDRAWKSANSEPTITQSAPAASAFAISPEYLTPPSAIIGTPASRPARAASITAVSCGTPTPATMRVVQIEPGPIPTFTASAPASIRARAAS